VQHRLVTGMLAAGSNQRKPYESGRQQLKRSTMQLRKHVGLCPQAYGMA